MLNTIATLDNVYTELKKNKVDMSTIYNFQHKKTKDKLLTLSLGRIWFNLILPEKEPIYDEQINSKRLNGIVASFQDK